MIDDLFMIDTVQLNQHQCQPTVVQSHYSEYTFQYQYQIQKTFDRQMCMQYSRSSVYITSSLGQLSRAYTGNTIYFKDTAKYVRQYIESVVIMPVKYQQSIYFGFVNIHLSEYNTYINTGIVIYYNNNSVLPNYRQLTISYNKTKMQGIIILIFEVLMIIFYGIFIRTDSITTSSVSSIDSSLFFVAGNAMSIVAYAFLNLKSKNLDWTVLVNFLFVVMIALQINTLYYYFWNYVFSTSTWSSTTSLSSVAFVNGVEATLTVIITISLFVNRLSQMSIFIITMLEVFFFAANWGICRWGINAVTSGGAMTVWLFGMTFAAGIKRMRYVDLQYTYSMKYFTKSLQVIALIILILFWPSFNQLTAGLDLTVANLDSGALLQQNAYFQTWLCLFSAIVTTLGLRVSGERINFDRVIASIINTGILISSSACFIIDPFASILIGICGPLISFAYDRYGQTLWRTGYPIDGILMGFLGGVLSSIFAGGRNGRTPALSTDPIKQGGLQFAALIVSLLFAIIFGLITGFLLRFISSDDVELTDMGIWQIESQMLPLYPDDPKFERLYKIEDNQRLHQQNLNFSLKQRYLTTKNKEAAGTAERGKILHQQVQTNSKII